MSLSACVVPGSTIPQLGAFNRKHSASLPCLKQKNGPLPHLFRISVSNGHAKFKGLVLACHVNKSLPTGNSSSFHFPGSSSALSGVSTSTLYGLQKLDTRASIVPRVSQTFSDPEMIEKPQWWWRSLACIPYLLPIADTLVCSSTVFQLQHFLDGLDFFAYPLLDTMSVMPSWFMMAFSFSVYLWVVRRKELPHFLRFHVIMAMLLGTASQIVMIASDWLPRTLFRGDMLQRFWMTFALMQLFTIFECMRCALSGAYADVPFVSDAAYIHSYLG